MVVVVIVVIVVSVGVVGIVVDVCSGGFRRDSRCRCGVGVVGIVTVMVIGSQR